MIPHFHRTAIDLGPAAIHGFGVLVAIAVLVGSKMTNHRVDKEGLSVDVSSSLLGWIFITAFLVAHLVDRLVYFPSETLADPITLVMVWRGLSSFGGFLGGILGAALFFWRRPQPEPWRYLDAVAYAFPFGWVFGRLGCFVAFDHPGKPTSFFLGQEDAAEVVRHNLGLEEALYMIPVVVLFYVLGRRSRPPRFFVGLLALVYAPIRFLLDFLRIVDVRYAGLTPGQFGSLALMLVGAALLLRARRGAAVASSQPA